MGDRDTFAAAALTGILARGAWVSSECAAEAYLHADAMIRKRGRTNHDAVPEAKADGQGRDNPATPDHVGTGNTPTLTDEERAALERVCVAYELLPSVGAKQVADTLSKLLERLT